MKNTGGHKVAIRMMQGLRNHRIPNSIIEKAGVIEIKNQNTSKMLMWQ